MAVRKFDIEEFRKLLVEYFGMTREKAQDSCFELIVKEDDKIIKYTKHEDSVTREVVRSEIGVERGSTTKETSKRRSR